MLKNRLFVVIFTMFCCNLFCLSLSKAGSLKSIKNIFGKQQSCLSSDSFKAEWDCNSGSFKTKLCAFGENNKISLIYSIIDDLNGCVNTKGNCTNVSKKITALKTEFGNSLPDNVRTCLGISGKETGIETLNNINDDVSSSNIDNYKNDIQKLYKYKYCLEGSETSETTDDILYADSDVKEKEGFLLLLYKQLYYELTAISNLVNIDEDKNHENYEYAKNQILVIVDRILYKENNQDSQGLLDIYAELDKINTTDYTNILTNIKDNKGGNLSNITKINEFRNTIKGQIASLEKAKISDCSNGGAISERDNNLENKYCNNSTNIVKQKYAKINSLMDELEVLKVTPIESEENVNNNIYHIESYITVMQNGINDIKTEIKDLKNLVNRYSSDLMMDVNACFNQYISIDTIIKNFDKLDFYFNADNNANSLVKYYRYLKELNGRFGGSTLYTKDEVNTAYTEFEKKIKTTLTPQEFYINFLNYNSSFINLIRSEENKAAEIFRQELFSEEVKAVVYDNAIIETMCYIMDLVTGNIGRSIMALSLIITAFMWLQGKIEPKELFSFVAAITIMYGSLSIANLIAKNNYSCGLAKSLEYIERTGSVDKCEDGFIWSISTNKCVAKSCYNPTMKNVIFYSDYAFYKGNSILGECTNGYEGTVNAKCIFADDDLSWEYTGGCEKIYCYIQPSYEGVEFNTKNDKDNEITTFDYQAKVSGKCKTGYKGEGYTATCTGKNKWNYSGSCQAIYCPALSRAADGTTKQASWPATKANSIGYGTCFSPYVNTYFNDFDLNPNSSRSVSFAFCDENGQWDFQKKNEDLEKDNPTLLKNIYSAKTKAKRDTEKENFQKANDYSKYSKYLCEISRCEAINIANSKTGNAIWPESDIGDENIIGICGSGYYYNNGTEKTINSVKTYDLKNQYLTDDEQKEIDDYFKNDLETILADLSDEVKKKYNLSEVGDLTDDIIRTLKIEEITAKMQNKDKDTILGKCEANGEIVTNNNMICYKRKCPAITVGDKNSNYATWPETDALTLVESSKDSDCITDYGGSHSAYCDEFGTWHFDSYTKGYKTIKLESCTLKACNEDITTSLRDNNGFSIIGSWDDKIKWQTTDEENATIKLIKDFEDRKQGQDIKVYCADNSVVYNYNTQDKVTFEKDGNGVSYIKATCSNKNEWETNGKCVYKPCEAIKKEDANLKTGWAYFDTKSYPESDSGWGGSCHNYFANDKKTFNSMLEKVNELLGEGNKLKSVDDLKGRVVSFDTITASLMDGRVISGGDASCQFDKDKDESVLSIAKNQCKVPVIFADLYKSEGVLKFFDVGEEIKCSKDNFNFEADADNNSLVCIMFTSTEDHYNYIGKRVNKSYRIIAVEDETITPGAISNITEFEDKMFDKAKTCHPVTAEMDIDRSTEHFSFGSNAEEYIYKSEKVLYQDSGLIKNKTERATYPSACAPGYVGNPVVECGDKGIWKQVENECKSTEGKQCEITENQCGPVENGCKLIRNKCEPGCYIHDIVNDIKNGNFQDNFVKIDTKNLFIDTDKNGKFETKLDFVKEPFVYAGTYLKIPLNGCKDGYAGIPIVKCEGSKWKWEMEKNTNNYCYDGGCYFSTYADAEGTSGWKILDNLNDFSKTRENAILKNKEYMIADCNDKMVSNKDNKFTNSTVSSIEQQKHIIAQCKDGTIEPYDKNSGTACVSGCIYGDTSRGWNENMFSGTDPEGLYSMFTKIGETTSAFSGEAGIFSVRNSTNTVVQKSCMKNYSAAEVKINGYSCNSSLSTQPVLQCENGEWKQYDTGGDEGKHCYTCGIVVQYYSPRDETLFKEKVLKEGDEFKCVGTEFGGDPDPNVKKLCRIKGSDKYFGYGDDGKTYKVGNDLFETKSSACHVAYVSKDLNSILLSDYTKAGGETQLHDNSTVYSAGVNDGGLRQDKGQYTIKCASGYAGAPEVVCDNGKWSWKPTENTDNYCYLNGCDTADYVQESKNLSDKGWGLETDDCTTSSCASGGNTARKIIPDGSWASAKCKSGFVSNVDNPKIDDSTLIARQKSVLGKCVNGKIEQTVNNVKYADACVRGCVYGDTSMGWTVETFKNTTGDYKQHDITNWGKANVGKYVVRKDADLGTSTLIYKNCEVGYAPGGDDQADPIYPLAKCDYTTGKWLQQESHYMGCEIISGCTEFVYQSNGDNNNQGLVAPVYGLINLKIQVWGAQGGNGIGGSAGGKGGYAYGELSKLPNQEKINVITGQWGGVVGLFNKVETNTKGAGQGGYRTGSCGKDNPGIGGVGGGGSKVWYNDKILQAGGGGGAGERGTHMIGGAGGGAKKGGGGLNGSNGVTNNNGDLAWTGHGGTTTGPGAGYGNWCGSGNGENGGHTTNKEQKKWYCGGAGGGGYYGGSGGSPDNEDRESAGGGGSGYGAGFDNIDGASGVQIANGLVRICWGNDTNCNSGSSNGKVSNCEGSKFAVNKDSNMLGVRFARNAGVNFYRYGTVFSDGCPTTTNFFYMGCYMPDGFIYKLEKSGGPFYVY